MSITDILIYAFVILVGIRLLIFVVGLAIQALWTLAGIVAFRILMAVLFSLVGGNFRNNQNHPPQTITHYKDSSAF